MVLEFHRNRNGVRYDVENGGALLFQLHQFPELLLRDPQEPSVPNMYIKSHAMDEV